MARKYKIIKYCYLCIFDFIRIIKKVLLKSAYSYMRSKINPL